MRSIRSVDNIVAACDVSRRGPDPVVAFVPGMGTKSMVLRIRLVRKLAEGEAVAE